MGLKDLFSKKTAQPVYDDEYYDGLQPSEEDFKAMLAAGRKPRTPDTLKKSGDAQKITTDPDVVTIPVADILGPIDSEDAAYKSWAADQEGSQKPNTSFEKKGNTESDCSMPKLDLPKVEPYGPIPPRPVAQPIKVEPYGAVSGNPRGKIIYPKSTYPGSSPFTTEKKWTPYKPLTKDVIAFVIENSSEVLKCKDEVLNIINKILEGKKTAIFLFIKVGNGQTSYDSYNPMDYNDVTKQGILSCLLNASDPYEQVLLAPALYRVRNMFKVFSGKDFTFKKTKYKLDNCSIICFGSDTFISGGTVKKAITTCITDLKKLPKLKTFKYFCVKDSDTIKVASMGFPVIGHIVSNFYE